LDMARIQMTVQFSYVLLNLHKAHQMDIASKEFEYLNAEV